MRSERASSLTGFLKHRLGPIYRRMRSAELWVEYHIRPPQLESRIENEAQAFWNADDPILDQYAHWRGAGIFSNEDRWLAMGQQHVRLYEQLVRMVGDARPLRRIVEWGCGGGANAVHFAPMAQEFVGIDVAEASLAESARQLSRLGLSNFVPVLISTSRPEEALSLVPGPADLLLCTYVYELLPTPEYGLRVLAIAHDLLAEGGLAIIQVKYMRESWGTKPKRFAYRRNFPALTSYRIDEFWAEAERAGLRPRAVTLVPRQPLNGSGNYAYFLMEKPTAARRATVEALARVGQAHGMVGTSAAHRPPRS